MNKLLILLLGLMLCSACRQNTPWNDPYPEEPPISNHLYLAFSSRPKHLDPARSYSESEWIIIHQIYEPLYQYHYLKRPYTLEPLTAISLPTIRFLDSQAKVLPADVDAGKIAYTEYEIRIKPGRYYQPHPAFVQQDAQYLYHHLTADEARRFNSIQDFPRTATRECVAEDFVYQIKRLAEPSLQSPIYGFMQAYLPGLKVLHDRLSALAHQPEIDLRAMDLPGVEVIDRYTFRIRTQGKYTQFKYWLAMPFFAPVPWEVAQFYAQPVLQARNITLDWYPVGTGPFWLAENNPERRMVLLRNPNFGGERYPHEGESGDKERGLLEDAGRPLPFVDKIVFSLEKEDIPYWGKFLQGYYDVSGVDADNFSTAIRVKHGKAQVSDELARQGIQLQTSISPGVFYWGFNMLDPVLGGSSPEKRRLRQAIALAFDIEEFIELFLNGRAVPAHGPVPPGIWGHQLIHPHPLIYRLENGHLQRRDLVQAKALLKAAGYENGIDPKTHKPLVIYYDCISTHAPDERANLAWTQKQFAKLGIDLVIRATDVNRFQDKLRQGNFQFFFFGWRADYPDPENFLFLLYGPNGRYASGGTNEANYQNPVFDQLFERMRLLEDTPEKTALLEKMFDLVQEDMPWIAGLHPQTYRLHHAWYHPSKPSGLATNTLKYVKVEGALRARSQAQWNRPRLWPLAALCVGLILLGILAYTWAWWQGQAKARRFV